jgi:hypothetical protein
MLPLRAVTSRGWINTILRQSHLSQGPRTPRTYRRTAGYGDDEGRAAVEEMEDDGTAAWTTGSGPHICPIG